MRFLVALFAAGAVSGPPAVVTPQITVSSPADGAVLTTKKITIEGTVTPNGSGIDHMTLNGQTVAPKPNRNPDGSYPFSFPVALKTGKNAFTIEVVDMDQTSAETTLTVTYRLPSCSVRAHDVGTKSEFDVKCTKAIANGSFTLVVNRSGCDAGCEPTARIAGQGHLGCSGRGLLHGKRPYEILQCEGSLAAGATAKVLQRFETPTIPCEPPAVKGTFSVSFGDGTKLKSRKLPAYNCPARTHKRFFGVFHAGLSAAGGAGFVAELDIRDGFLRCIKHVPILVQVRSGGGWRTVLRTRTQSRFGPVGHGVFRSAVFGVTPSSSGYRVVAPKVRFGKQTCALAAATTG